VNLGSGCTNTQESYFYNNRLQMAVAELGTPGANGAKSCREYSYQANVTPSGCAESSTSWPTGSANNGNVAGYYYADSANGGLSHKASYVYDGGNGANGVNRLTSALATPVLSGTVGYSQSFSYDIYGNMSCSASPAEPQCLAATYNDTNYPNPNSNRLQYITSGGVNVSYGYDLAGNLTNDGTNTYYWDAEARLTAVTNGQGTISANTYNALGQRVEDATLTSTTEEAYGAGGSLLLRSTGDSNSRTFVPFGGGILAEYYCGGMIFDHPDQLGSATSATDCTGNIVNAKLFLPFGEFWTGAANPNLGMHQMFAQLPDYDPETDEYNTANRHYSPSGRWLSPDPGGLKYVHLDDPQTWNMYAYVRDNPTTVTDPTGLGDPPPNGAPASARGDGCDKPSNDCNQAAANVLAGMAIGLYNSGADMLNLVLQVDYHAPAEALLPEIPLEGSEQKIGALASAGVFFMIPGGGEEETGVELASRASEIHSALDDVIAQGMRTTAVADVTNADGTASRVVASSEKNLAPVQKAALREGETAVSGKGHAEQKIAGWAERNGAKINAIAASRPICTSCQTLIRTMIDLMIH
jgi:RHS repeat-associated protein